MSDRRQELSVKPPIVTPVALPESPRLSYRFITAADAEALFELDQDPEVMRFITKGKVTTRQQLQELVIPRMQSYADRERGWGLWKVSEPTLGFIGWILVRPMDFFSDAPQWDTLELGWRFKRSAWGQGFASEAAAAVLAAIKASRQCTKVCAIADPDNHASKRIMTKLGMRYVKSYDHVGPLGTDPVDYFEMVLG